MNIRQDDLIQLLIIHELHNCRRKCRREGGSLALKRDDCYTGSSAVTAERREWLGHAAMLRGCGTAATRDNAEFVFLPAGTTGNFSITVTAFNIAGDGVPGNADTTDQDFALALLDEEGVATVHGAAFGLQPLLLQSAAFRPHNRSEDIERLYLVGAGTHPGAGVPGVLSSARVLDTVVPHASALHA